MADHIASDQAAERIDALVIGAGPAGLMAAEALADAGHRVVICEGKPSPARKFLMAGKSGLNLTKDEPTAQALAHYGAGADFLTPMLTQFGPAQVQDWARALGQEVFTGSSGRVFPVAMKASPLLRAWLARLAAKEVILRSRWLWRGWRGDDLHFHTPVGPRAIAPRVTVLALGGASWARLGSDGAWAPHLAARGVTLAPFAPANMGFGVAWSSHMEPHFGQPIKPLGLSAGAAAAGIRGEIVLTARGIEGGGLYQIARALREGAGLSLDLLPDLSTDQACAKLAKSARDSGANRLRKAFGLTGARRALVMELLRPLPQDPAALVAALKALPIAHDGPFPMDEAISTAGGVCASALDAGLMLRALPDVFCAGEMLDWEAPTGGYLLTACLATGLWAGQQAARRLACA